MILSSIVPCSLFFVVVVVCLYFHICFICNSTYPLFSWNSIFPFLDMHSFFPSCNSTPQNIHGPPPLPPFHNWLQFTTEQKGGSHVGRIDKNTISISIFNVSLPPLLFYLRSQVQVMLHFEEYRETFLSFLLLNIHRWKSQLRDIIYTQSRLSSFQVIEKQSSNYKKEISPDHEEM